MAETTKRSQLIRQQLENLLKNAPQPYTEAEKNQIMKGRKKQADIDAGRATIEARNTEVRDFNKQITQLNSDLGTTETQEGTEAEKQKREEGANPLGNRLVPGVIGAAAGSGITYGLNKIVGGGDKANAEALKEIGEEIGPTEKLTNSQMNRSRAVGASEAAKQFAPTSKLSKALDFGKRVGTYAVPVGFIANEYQKYQAQADDESLPWEERQAAQRVANGFLGGFTGIGVEGAARFFNKKVEPGVGQAMMRINTARDYASRMDERDVAPQRSPGRLSRALSGSPTTIDAEVIPESLAPKAPTKALPPPDAPEAPSEVAPEPKVTTPGTKAHMAEQAKAFGVKGTSRMSKSQLAEALAKTMSEHGGKRTVPKRTPKLPGGTGAAAIAGGLAYALTPDSAEAADGGPLASRSEALTNAGITAGGTYGVSKLAQALGPMAGKAFSMGGSMMGPMSVGDMTDMSSEEAAQARQQIAAVPGNVRNALRGAMTPGNATPEETQGQVYPEALPPSPAPQQAPAPQPMMQASALDVPTDIPENAAMDAEMAARFGGGRYPGPTSGPGMLDAGNINLANRPRVRNPDGSISTVRSMSANMDDKEVLMPTVSDDGRIMSDDEAINQYRTSGKHFGTFDTPENATAFAQALHQDQERFYAPTESDMARFSPNVQGRLNRMISGGASPDQIASWLNQAVRN